tara:strand:+ start:364 stop:795 length:432 start_codon:yes stop_codon:yes gene_type:complete
VPNRTAPLFDRLTAALCALLMIVYAATMPAKAADQIEHAPALMIAHEHSGPESFSLDTVHDHHDAHAEHHEDTSDGENEPSDLAAGGHHHHGDSGPNLIVPDAAAAHGAAPSANLHEADGERQIAGLRSPGPERPPRSISLTI